MVEIDLSSMQPPDAAVALRTLPRRYRDAAASASTADLDGEPDDAEIDAMAARVGADGHSAADLVAAATAHVERIDSTLRSALVSDATVVSDAAVDVSPPVVHHPGARPFAAAVERLAERCAALADLVDDADPSRWTVSLPTEGGGSTSPLQVLQRGVGALVSWERQLSPLLRSVRGRPG